MSVPPRIAILADFPLHSLPNSSFPPPTGHYATWLPQLAAAFQGQNDFEFHWLTLDPSVAQETTIRAWNQFFHVLPTLKRGRAATLFWADRRRIRKKLKEIRPDLVHGWGTENIWGWATLEFPGPQLFSVQGLLGLYGKVGRQGLRDRWMALIERNVLRKVQTITTESPWAREQIEKQTGRKDIHLVEYGVADRFFAVEPSPDLLKPYVLMIGTADYRKGIDLAVQIFSRAALQNYSLKIVGGISPFGKIWKKRSPGNVEWLGRKSQNEIIDLMAKSWCLILPSRADVCANVVKEARVIGLPVVASPHGGHTQYIDDGKNGFICPLNSPKTWEDSLLQILSRIENTKIMGSWMKQEHRRHLHSGKTAERFVTLYRKALD